MGPEDINKLIRNRRSIFPAMYTGQVVDDKIIQQMLENANWAPTHRLTEPWRFRVFTGKGIQKLAAFQAAFYEGQSREQGNFSEEKFKKLQEKPLLASHILSIGMARDPKKSVPEYEEIAAVASAVQNMQLTATAYGVGCYWSSGGPTMQRAANDFFGLGNEDLLLGFLYVGMPGNKWPRGHRKDIAEKVTWVRE